MDKDPSSIEWERVTGDEPDILYISSIFDVLEWWKSIGRDKYPLVYMVALSIIALPASNAFLERIFSTCTRFDIESKTVRDDRSSSCERGSSR